MKKVWAAIACLALCVGVCHGQFINRGQTSINGRTGPYIFTGSGVSCVNFTCTFTSSSSGITLTTTGTSGAATLTGSTLNIPVYAGGLTSFTVGNFAPLFTAALGANPTTAPALAFTISNAAQNSVLAGPVSGGAGAYSFQTAPTFSAANLTSIPACATCATSANNLGFFAATTSAQLAGVISDEIGTGKLVFATSPAFLGTVDASGATQFKLPVVAGFTSAANGELGYDSTNLNWHLWNNAVDNFVAVFPVASPPITGHCAQWLKSTNTWTLADAGAACGSGGGTPAYPLTITGGVSGGVVYANSTTQLTVSPAGTVNVLMKWGGAGAAPGSSSMTDNGTTISTPEPMTVGSSLGTTADGVHPSYMSWVGNTTNPGLTANTFGILGPTIASPTAFAWQAPSATNGSAGLVHVAANSGAISLLSVSQVSLTADVTGVLPVANGGSPVADTTITVGSGVAFSANTCSSYTGTGGTASTTTMTGLTTGMTVVHTPASDVHAVTGWSPGTGGQLYFTSWPTSNTLNDYVCNPTSSTITTGSSVTWNVSAR